MTMVKRWILLGMILGCGWPIFAQQPASAPANAVPSLVNFSGVLTDVNGKPLSGIVGVTFFLYKDQQGGVPLWMETQNVEPDKRGHYSVMLGSTHSSGLPFDIFVAGEARWLGVQVQGQAEQPRVLLLSVPYALKAGDAATVGGLPPSAFVLALPSGSNSNNSDGNLTLNSSLTGAVNGTGATDFIPLWTNSTTLGNSVLFQSGTGSTAKVGINTTIPSSTLDVNGSETIRGSLNLTATSTATATAGKNSQPISQTASAFNSSTKKAVSETFQWQAEAAGNNTSSPSGTLNLLFGSGANKPSESGLHIASNGQISFAAGQTFPGAGTITQVSAGTDLTGGGNSGNVTLNVDTSKVPQLNTANTFTASQTVNANLIATGVVGIGTTTPQGTLDVLAAAANEHTFIGDVGCGHNNAGIIFGTTLNRNCQTFTLAGDTGSNTYLNAPGGELQLRVFPNVIGLTVDTSANVEIPNNLRVGGGVTGTATTDTEIGLSAGGFSGSSGSGLSGGPAIHAVGGSGDPTSISTGGDGIQAFGGNAGCCNGSGTGEGGFGITALGGSSASSSSIPAPGGVFVGGNAPSCAGTTCGGDGIFAQPGENPSISVVDGYAGNFNGDLNVTGAITAGTKDFKIDHPLDPANKYLLHASVESSEMVNIYTGNATTDAQGQATVQLPEWFEVLNTDFRYQLTVIGQFAQAIVAHEIENHQFTIRTSAPSVKVSWQVTGVRQDAYAKAHPLVVEQEKDARLKGFYIHPEFYGAPAEKQIEWARHPQLMTRRKEMQAGQIGRLIPDQATLPAK